MSMSALELTVRLVEALGWPITALVIVLILRHPLRQMLTSRPPSKVKAGPFEVEWDRVLAETEKEVEASGTLSPQGNIPGTVREELSAEATVAPAVAVREAHATVERHFVTCSLLLTFRPNRRRELALFVSRDSLGS
jgi:hypothetical protein